MLYAAALLLGLSTAFASPAKVPRGHVVVHKSLSGPNGFPALVEGREFNVTYIVQNLGTGPAYAVSLSDEWDTSSFKMVRAHGGSFSPAGAISASWNQLMPNANETVIVEMIISAGQLKDESGSMTPSRATVDYKYRVVEGEDEVEDLDADPSSINEEDLQDVTGGSTTPGRVEIIKEALWKRLIADRTTPVNIASWLAAVLSFGPFLLYSRL